MDKFDLIKTSEPPPEFLASRIKRGRYLFPNMKAAREGPAVICAGWEECHSDFEIVRPAFPYEAVELLAEGEWKVRSGRRLRHCKPGTLVVYGPGRPLSLRAAGSGPHIKYFIDLAGRRSRDLIKDCGLAKRAVVPLVASTRLIQLFEQILCCREIPQPASNRTVRALAEALLRRAGCARTAHTRASAHTSVAFERCRHYLEEHYPEINSISAAASKCHVSTAYFSRLFRRHAGVTAERFLATLRVNHAARLLQQTKLSVKEAGHMVGFKDPYHFSRLFKRLHGTSPAKFRDSA